MSEPAIRVVGLGKQYRIGSATERYDALRDRLAHALAWPLRVLRPGARRRPACGPAKPGERLFWALRDLTFEVPRGQVLGVIGRNGAGKSTLLRVLSRITTPNAGWAEVRGRVGSLLEVGTGFHPELTGRENVFLNGAILGMRKAEIERKFDEIVSFAEVDRFVDTPVKRYSSGMYLRLAFAVAAHLDPEILFVDEVLAVGDLAFQKKCLGKMGEVAGEGRTVLLVTHQMHQIRRVCDRVLWIEEGRLRRLGKTAEVTNAYEASHVADRGEDRAGRGIFTGWRFLDRPADACHALDDFGPCTIGFDLSLARPMTRARFGLSLWDRENRIVWGTAREVDLPAGRQTLRLRLPYLPLKPGPYVWRLSLADGAEARDVWFARPDLQICTVPRSSVRQERWTGFLNLPHELERGEAERAP